MQVGDEVRQRGLEVVVAGLTAPDVRNQGGNARSAHSARLGLACHFPTSGRGKLSLKSTRLDSVWISATLAA